MSNSTWDFGYSKLTTENYTYMRFYLTNLSTGYVVRELFSIREFDKNVVYLRFHLNVLNVLKVLFKRFQSCRAWQI